MVFQSKLDKVSSVSRLAMRLVQRLSTAALLLAVAGIGISPAAQAHPGHHHSHKKQKAYNAGYRKGYRKAIKQAYRPYYRTYAPVYPRVRRRVVVAPAPVVIAPAPVVVAPARWVAPVRPKNYRTKVKVGVGFNL